MKLVWCMLSLIFFLTSCSHQTRKLQDLNPLQILNPSRANQKSSKFICCNGLKLLIISSPDTTTSGAALVVKTGNNADPDAFPGMAHFTEHCVFLGNKKYPKTSAFTHFLSKHNGVYNAFTSSNTTSYLFSVESSSFNQAIEQFVHLFIQPLFRQEDLDREKHAVHEEFAMHPTKDSRRMQRIEQLIAPEGYPTKRFGCGNLSTLSSVTSQDMHDWYDKHYSPQNMLAIVYTSEPLEQAEQRLPSLFEKIKQSKKYKPQPPFVDTHDETTLNKIFINKSVQPTPLLEIYWNLYDLPDPIPSSCFVTLEHLIQYEGENSLVFLLKERGWISNLQLQHYRTSHNTADFCIIYELTDKGDEEYEQVINYTFAYMNYIKNQSMPLYCLEEISKINSWNYSYGPKIKLFDALHASLADFIEEDFSTYPYRSLVLSPFTLQKEASLFSELQPTQARIVLSTTKQQNLIKTKEHFDPIFNMTFYEKDMLKNSEYPELSFALPRINEYIPEWDTSLPLTHGQKQEGFPFSPKLMYQTKQMSLYQCDDSYYTTPQLATKFRLRTPKIVETNVSSLVLADLYCTMLNDLLSQAYYPALLAGFSCILDQNGDGIDINLSGHTKTFSHLLQNLTTFIKQTHPSYNWFLKYKEQLRQVYEQKQTACPIRLGLDHLTSHVVKNKYPVTTKLDHLKKLTYHEFKLFCDQLYKEIYVEGLILGSLTEEQKDTILTILETFVSQTATFNAPPYSEQSITSSSPLLISYNFPSNAAIILLRNEENISSTSQAATQMFFKWFAQIVFSELRTKQQLGYVVGATYQEIAQYPCGIIYLRSDTHSAEKLAQHGLTFLNNTANHLEDFGFSEPLFLDLKHAYIQQIKNPTISFEKMPVPLFSILFEQQEQITPNDKITAAEQLTYAQFKNYCEQLLLEQLGPHIQVLVSGTK